MFTEGPGRPGPIESQGPDTNHNQVPFADENPEAVLDYIKCVLDVYCEETGLPWAHDEDPDDKLVRVASEVPAIRRFTRTLPKMIVSLRQVIAHTDYEVPDALLVLRVTTIARGLGRTLSSEAARRMELNTSPEGAIGVLAECLDVATDLGKHWQGMGGDELADAAEHRIDAMRRLIDTAGEDDDLRPLIQLALAERERLNTCRSDLAQQERENAEIDRMLAEQERRETEEFRESGYPPE